MQYHVTNPPGCLQENPSSLLSHSQILISSWQSVSCALIVDSGDLEAEEYRTAPIQVVDGGSCRALGQMPHHQFPKYMLGHRSLTLKQAGSSWLTLNSILLVSGEASVLELKSSLVLASLLVSFPHC